MSALNHLHELMSSDWLKSHLICVNMGHKLTAAAVAIAAVATAATTVAEAAAAVPAVAAAVAAAAAAAATTVAETAAGVAAAVTAAAATGAAATAVLFVRNHVTMRRKPASCNSKITRRIYRCSS